MAIVGSKAPQFSAAAVVNGREIIKEFSLEQYIGKQNVILFFYPKDFTFVCPTELLKLQQKKEAFAERDTAIVACSTDTEETHWAWLHVSPQQGGISGVTFPLIADTDKTISANFDVLGGNWYVDDQQQLQFEGTPVAYRGVFLIDKEGIVRHALINDLPLGRNVDELLRTVDMLSHVEKYGEVCPANWQTGDEAMQPTPKGVASYLTHHMNCGCACTDCPCEGTCACGDTCPCPQSNHAKKCCAQKKSACSPEANCSGNCTSNHTLENPTIN